MYLPSHYSSPPTGVRSGTATSATVRPAGSPLSVSPTTSPRPLLPCPLGLLNPGPLPQGSKLMAYMSHRAPPPLLGANGSQGGVSNALDLVTAMSNLPLDQKAMFSDGPATTLTPEGTPTPPGPSFRNASSRSANLNNIQEFVPASAAASGTTSSANGVMALRPPHGSDMGRLYARSPGPNHLASAGSNATSQVNDTEQSGRHSPSADSVDAVAAYSDGGTTYFFAGDDMGMSNHIGSHAVEGSSSTMLPDYTSFAGTPSYVANMRVRANVPGFMADSEIKIDLLKRQQICLAQLDAEQFPSLPTEVDNFKELCPLEAIPQNPSLMGKSHTFGYVTSVYKATNMKSGLHVCLRRIHGYRLVNTKCMMLVEQWRKLSHPNLVALRQVFTTKSFGDHSMVFVYDLYPCAETLMDKHFSHPAQTGNAFLDPFSGTDGSARPYSQQKNQMLRQQALLSQNGLLAESIIWSYVIQLTSSLRHIHSAELACRTLDPTKILVINKSRLLLNCGGIFDVITFDPSASNPLGAMAHYQQEDLVSLGKIVLALACNSFLAIQRENLQTSMEIVTSTYSTDLRNLIMYLLTNPNRVKSVNDLMPMIGARFYTHLDSAYVRCDAVEAELAKEVECGRLFRLSTKVSTVVDRAELNGDFGWSEYGDRYMLKLFRDYVFHQVMEDNRPWLDMAHVITCLNKLDAGSPEKVCLMSRDEQNVLVVSYSELKHCLEQSFAECVQSGRMGTTGGVNVGGGGAITSQY